MKQRIIILLALAILAAGTLFALHLNSDGPNKHLNGFSRKMLPVAVQIIAKHNFDVHFTELCGANNNELFLSGRIPGKVYRTNRKLDRLDTITLPLPNIPKLAPVFYTMVEYPNLYILAGNSRKLITGNFISHNTKVVDLPIGPFGNGTMIGTDCFMVRAIDTGSKNAQFIKITASGSRIEKDNAISKELKDAGFTHDGMLNYDQKTSSLIYVDYYSNEVTCFDTSLQVKYRSHTIDTTFISPIHVGRNQSKLMTSGPALMVNRNSFVYNGTLYVISNLKADNEDQSKFSNNSVVDEYSVSNGQYKGSFYLPVKSNTNPKIYMLNDGTVVIITKDELQTVDLKSK
jgi:uncharacterized protein YxeA